VPIPRMTTTFIAGGSSTEQEIIAATDHGFYAKSLAGGQVEPASGNFVFGVAEGYLIEKGVVTRPLRGATLVGNGIEVLNSIDMIAGDDFLVKSGMCGKDGQSVPVGTGQPTLRIREMTVGGTG
jgi:TldD protein